MRRLTRPLPVPGPWSLPGPYPIFPGTRLKTTNLSKFEHDAQSLYFRSLRLNIQAIKQCAWCNKNILRCVPFARNSYSNVPNLLKIQTFSNVHCLVCIQSTTVIVKTVLVETTALVEQTSLTTQFYLQLVSPFQWNFFSKHWEFEAQSYKKTFKNKK